MAITALRQKVHGDKSNLDLDINAPSLRGLWQDLAGSVVGKAQILGKLTAPTINTDLTAQGLHFQGLEAYPKP